MRRLTADHLAGGRGHETALVDEWGQRVLGLAGSWAVTDDDGRWTLYIAPDYGAIAKRGDQDQPASSIGSRTKTGISRDVFCW